MQQENTFTDITNRLQDLQEPVGLSDKAIKLLTTPKKIHKTQLEVNDQKLPAWRILFNDALGPGKGGIRFHPQANEDEVKSLSFWMMIKNALAGLPYGGAKGAVQFDPRKVSEKEKEAVSRTYIKEFYPHLGENKDIPAPDVYTDSQVMAWMLDEYEKQVSHHEPAMITGKPLVLGGSAIRSDATAHGAFVVIEAVVNDLWQEKVKPTIAIQGFGNAGANLADYLDKAGYKMIAVSDSSGGIYNKNGLDIAKVQQAKEGGGEVAQAEGEKITNEELLKLPVDILVPAALENQITVDNADEIQAQYIVEVANGPTTYEADQILQEKKVTVIPDILTNAGGVTASYFEWAQNKTGNILDKTYLENLLEEKMAANWQRVFQTRQENYPDLSFREVAYIIAVKRILEAERLRGN